MGAVAAVVCLAVGLTACGGGGGGGDEGESSGRATGKGVDSAGKLTSWSRACDGIFDAETVAVLKKGTHAGGGYELPGDGGAKRAVAEAGRKLGEGMDSSALSTSVCQIEDERGRRLLDISFKWHWLMFPAKEAEAGRSVMYEVSEPRTFVLVDCRRPDLAEPGRPMRALRGITEDQMGLGLNERERVKALYASAAKVLATLDCQNKVTFPAPPKTIPGLA